MSENTVIVNVTMRDIVERPHAPSIRFAPVAEIQIGGATLVDENEENVPRNDQTGGLLRGKKNDLDAGNRTRILAVKAPYASRCTTSSLLEKMGQQLYKLTVVMRLQSSMPIN